MDQMEKILTFIAVAFGAGNAIMILVNFYRLRTAQRSNNPNEIDDVIQALIWNIGFILASVGIVTYATGLLNKITF
ncbi:hypothetical protein V4S38_03155 [Enterococcus cecorum]